MLRALLFDWGDTVMRVLPYPGPMAAWPEVAAMPGAQAALAALHGRYRLALATNAADSGAGEVRRALARVGLDDYFDLVLTARELGARKPSPGFFRAALQALGCDATEVAMVGDDYEADILGAKHAGLLTVWIDRRSLTGSTVAYPAADRRLSSLEQLPEALEELERRAAEAAAHDGSDPSP
ncbi:MAG: HAD family hydrolase [Anaerolineae bacterium]